MQKLVITDNNNAYISKMHVLNYRYAERVVRFVEEWLLGAKLEGLAVKKLVE